ncbi:unannotated protein [freshwater metagenome]|jgi:hypothetical protein|uniref:Unannotated protein n=1 Tax=freshwater metagenome TaxID=449393 RepID=A0A6J7CUD2_9ZZZZ|nr:hypothetical protein [Actinomycetota bacterium]
MASLRQRGAGQSVGKLSWWRRWTRSESELDADELRNRAERHGATAIDRCDLGQRCHVVGVLRTVTIRPRSGVQAVAAELFDGSGAIQVVWLGRRSIVGINPGRVIAVHGRINQHSGELVMFNPKYELIRNLDD